jgi:hypothetical protein
MPATPPPATNAWKTPRPARTRKSHLAGNGTRDSKGVSFHVLFAPPNPSKRLSIREVLDAVVSIVGDSIHMARVEGNALNVCVVGDDAAEQLLAKGATLSDGSRIPFFRGERRGTVVRVYGLPFTATHADVHEAMTAQLGSVNALVMRVHPGTRILTGEAMAWVDLTVPRAKGAQLSVCGRKVRCKVEVLPEPEATRPDTENEAPPASSQAPSAAPPPPATPQASAKVPRKEPAAGASVDVDRATAPHDDDSDVIVVVDDQPPPPTPAKATTRQTRTQGLISGFLLTEEQRTAASRSRSPAPDKAAQIKRRARGDDLDAQGTQWLALRSKGDHRS